MISLLTFLRKPMGLLAVVCAATLLACRRTERNATKEPTIPAAKEFKIKGFDRSARVEEGTGTRLGRLIRGTGLTPLINGGQFAVNEFAEHGPSILILSPKSLVDLDLGEMGGAYDRLADCILLQDDVVPSADVIDRFVRNDSVTDQEMAAIRFCQFLLMHECGHREKGSKGKTRFYFDGAWLSEAQSEELAADTWAMKALVTARRTGSTIDSATMVRQIANSALRRHFGRHRSLVDIPSEHPSMFYRIASLYAARSAALDPGKIASDEAPEADLIWQLAHELETHLASIVTMPDGLRVQDMSASLGKLFVLTSNGALHSVEAQPVLYGDALASQDARTVRRYSRFSLGATGKALAKVSIQGIGRVSVVDDVPYVVDIASDKTSVFDALGRMLAIVQNPVPVRSPGNVPVVTSGKQGVTMVFRNAAELHLVSVGTENGAINSQRLTTSQIAPEALVDVIGVRGEKILVSVADDTREIWALGHNEQPEYLVSSVEGHLFEPTMGLIGLGALGYQRGKLVDFRKGEDTEIKLDRYYLGRIMGVHRMLRCISEFDANLVDLVEPGSSSRTSPDDQPWEWVNVACMDRIDSLETIRFATCRRGAPEFYVFSPFDFSASMDLNSASNEKALSSYKKHAQERRDKRVLPNRIKDLSPSAEKAQ